MKKIGILIFLLLLVKANFAQTDDVQVGSNLNKLIQNQGALYDFSDPEAVNIKVSVWGYVKFPGRYIIPSYSNINDLLSFSGGPTQDANMEDLRIFRLEKDSSQTLINFDYNDLLWTSNIEKIKLNKIPEVKAGDILLVPGSQRLFFRDWLTLGLAILSTLISLAILFKK
jgi:protein involved in polysaccharide export with SLBB domain